MSPPRLHNMANFGPVVIFGGATVCKTVRPMLSVRSLSVCPVLSVTFVHCGQTVERIKMKLGMQVGLVPGHIVLDGDPAPLPKGAQSPQFSAHICCGQMAGCIKMRCHLVWM